MALNYYSVEKTAEVLGVSVDEVRGMRERRELYVSGGNLSWPGQHPRSFRSTPYARIGSSP